MRRSPSSDAPFERGMPDQTGSSSDLSNFQFTFGHSSTNSGPSSFIEPDPDPAELDTISLTDSVLDFPEAFGRRYHAYKAGSYAFPNDLLEQERLALQGEILRQLFGEKLFFSPLIKSMPPRAILDIATGLGDWAIQMGDLFPDSQVIGTDLSPIQPVDVPPNVNFYVEDSSEPWEYSHNFDFIHTRVTMGCWSNFQTQIAEQAFRYLNPGGYFESHEIDHVLRCDDGTLREDSQLLAWISDLVVASEACDRPIAWAGEMKRIYQEVGFVDVQQRAIKLPMNAWPKDDRLKELGRMWNSNFASGLGGFSVLLFNRVYGRTPSEIEVELVKVRDELSDMRIHGYFLIYAVWGRKPFPGETRSEAPPTFQQRRR